MKPIERRKKKDKKKENKKHPYKKIARRDEYSVEDIDPFLYR